MRGREWFWRMLGIILFVGVWQSLGNAGGGLTVASPLETLEALRNLLLEKGFWTADLLITLERVSAGFALGTALGVFVGCGAGLWPQIALLLAPFRWVLSSVPGVVLVILAMLWCGVGSVMVIAIVGFTVAPTMYLAVQEGIRSIDPQLCEMARIYRLGACKRFVTLYLPGVSAPLLSACVVALGGGMRVAILGETLGASRGLGYTLAVAQSRLDTGQLYAVALLSMLLVSLVEATLLRALRTKLQPRGVR